MKRKTLYRWVEEGITKADRRTQENLDSICDLLNVTSYVLWRESSNRAEVCADKVREIVEIWERVGVETGWIDGWHVSVRSADRFRREERELCERIRRVQQIDSDVALQLILERQIRESLQTEKLSEAQALAQLRCWAIEQ
jgi:hypothetical protein